MKEADAAKNTGQGVPGITTNDVQFTIDILNEVENLYCIDPSHITATGKSDGAGFCNILACDSVASKRIAAFAPVSGVYYVNTLPCIPSTVDIPCCAARKDIPMLAASMAEMILQLHISEGNGRTNAFLQFHILYKNGPFGTGWVATT